MWCRCGIGKKNGPVLYPPVVEIALRNASLDGPVTHLSLNKPSAARDTFREMYIVTTTARFAYLNMKSNTHWYLLGAIQRLLNNKCCFGDNIKRQDF